MGADYYETPDRPLAARRPADRDRPGRADRPCHRGQERPDRRRRHHLPRGKAVALRRAQLLRPRRPGGDSQGRRRDERHHRSSVYFQQHGIANRRSSFSPACAPDSAHSAGRSRTCPPPTSASPPRARRWPGRASLPAAVDHVVFGNVLQTSADAPYLARHIGLRAGLPIETPAVTVNRLCGSGFEAVVQACAADPAGRIAGGAGGRHRIDEPGAARGARRALGTPPGQRAAARGLALGGAPRHLLRPLHGGDRGEPGSRDTGSRATRWTATPRGARPARGPRGIAAIRGRGRAGEVADRKTRQDSLLGRRRAHAPGHHARSAGQAATLLQEGRRGHRRQRVRHLRRRRRPGARPARLRPGARPQAAGAAGGVGRGGRGARRSWASARLRRRGRRSTGQA